MKHTVLYNQWAANPCAYCKLHRVSLTVKQMKMKKCISKNCHALVRYKHPYWEERERIKQEKKQRKKQERGATSVTD